MSLKIFLPFTQTLEDDEVLGLGESAADAKISDGEDQGLRFTADDWNAIIEALYGIDGLISVPDEVW